MATKATRKKAAKKTTRKKKTTTRKKTATKRVSTKLPVYEKIGKRQFMEIIQLSVPERELTRADAEAIHDNIMSSIVQTVTKKKGLAALADVGRVKYTMRKARMGRNPQTGAAIKIPAKKTVRFTVAKALKSI
jgi:DNA-binding protein HU-beta